MTPRNQPIDRDGNPTRHGTQDKINRLRERIDRVVKSGNNHPIIDVVKGVLDLLEDEL